MKKFLIVLFLSNLITSFAPTNLSEFLVSEGINNYTDYTLTLSRSSGSEKVIAFAGKIDDLPTNSLYEILLSTGQYKLISTFGDVPEARYQHCAVIVSGYKLYIYGGLNSNDTILNDLWLYDSIGISWSKLGSSS